MSETDIDEIAKQASSANDRSYVYAIHIAATADQVWKALTQTDFIQKYWPEWNISSDWQAGSPVSFQSLDGSYRTQGEVLESIAGERLSYTWPEPEAVRVAALPERLSWEISDSGPGTVKLKLVHDRLTEAYYRGVSEGWPAILSSLKSLIEQGSPLSFHPHPHSA